MVLEVILNLVSLAAAAAAFGMALNVHFKLKDYENRDRLQRIFDDESAKRFPSHGQRVKWERGADMLLDYPDKAKQKPVNAEYNAMKLDEERAKREGSF